jgi:cysteinyl-tRNA synthetase
MDDDLNTAQALAVVSEALTCLNQARTTAERPDAPAEALTDLAIWVAVFEQMLDVLGILDASAQEQALAAAAADADTPAREALVNLLLQQRAAARAAKVWALSDILRDRLGALGIAVKDTPQGATWSLDTGATLPSFDALMALIIEARAEARKAKAWTVADAIRDALAAQGLTLEDGPSGTTWRHA